MEVMKTRRKNLIYALMPAVVTRGLPPVSAQILNKGQHRSITHRSPRKQVLRLRSMVARGRARTADPIIEPVFRLPNEMCWHVLKFWRATCPTTGEVL